MPDEARFRQVLLDMKNERTRRIRSIDKNIRHEGMSADWSPAFGCEFNRSMQHLISGHREGSVEMKQRLRIYYTEAQKTEMWDLWQQGDSLHAIARLFDRRHSYCGTIPAPCIWPRLSNCRNTKLLLTRQR